ncbi:hypothetical protein FDP41_007757 [Naegleria fowleri]|uniref:Uncharacterized protein n=1 Tax=Naegleria fowleri TaxID=5763 RepID=A0A6A5CA30_NAEFO|nr:uncharacterized protein FDP41_007757 [Naegleria fowleri]KAF0983842.1 hypothetical protein FDP41_007757 [Naegleria fowleri]CAG4714069.1 unnamed protein product [Naegleria fowleri]
MLSHREKQSNRQKSQYNKDQKNKNEDFWKFINVIKQSITHDPSILKNNVHSEPNAKKIKLRDHRRRAESEESNIPNTSFSESDDGEEEIQDESVNDKLKQATEDFLRNIKDPNLMEEAITLLDEAFSKKEWERILFQNVIRSLQARTTNDGEDTSRVIRVAYDLQQRKMSRVLLLFHLVDLLMKGYSEGDNITASSFMDLLVKRNYAHITWMINATSVLVSCKNDQFNSAEIKENIGLIIEDYIDQWIFRLEFVDESDLSKIEKRKKKKAFYNRVLPKQKLNELKKILLPEQETVQDFTNTVNQSTFKYRKRKERFQRAIKFIQRKSAFEVHEVVVRLHYTKHLLRNYVSSKMEIDEQAFIEQAKKCIYKFDFSIKKSSWNRSALNEYLRKRNMSEVKFQEMLVDAEGKDNEITLSTRNTSSFSIRLDTSDPYNLWVEYKFPCHFRFTAAHIDTKIDADDNELLIELFQLTITYIYQTSEVDNYESYSRAELWNPEKKCVEHSIVKKNAFYTPEQQEDYFDRDLVRYPITSVAGPNKLNIGIEFRGRRMKTNQLDGSYGTLIED